MLTNQEKLVKACVEGALEQVKMLLELPDVAVNKTAGLAQTPLLLACRNGHLEVVEALLGHGAVVVINQGNANGETPLFHACKNGHLKLIQALLGHGAAVVINWANKDGETPLFYACQHGHLKLVQVLLHLGAAAVINRANKDGETPFSQACYKGHFKVVQALLAVHPNVAVNQADRSGKTPLHKACREGHLEVVQALLGYPDIDVNRADRINLTPFYLACRFGHLEVVQALLGHSDIDVNRIRLDHTLLCLAGIEGYLGVVQALLARDDIEIDAKGYAYMETHQREYGDIADSFTKDYLVNLNQEIDKHPGMLFDFPRDDEGNPDTEKALMGYYVLRHLIRCSEVNELGQLAAEVNIQENIELLLNVPSVKALVIANATSRELPANYLLLGDRRFAQQTNELLRLAQNVGNEAIAARLLDIPAIREAAEANNFYEGEYGVNLAEVAHDKESSMRALTPEEQESVKRVEETYKKTIQDQGGISAVIESLKLTLIKKYLADDASSMVTLNGVDYSLPFEWNDLQQFIQDHDCTQEQQEKIAQVYYQNPYHTAYRYLSKPNCWMAEDAGWVYISDDRQERWSTFEEYLPLIAYLWIAANDDAHPPAEDNVSVEDRVNLFIRQIALINRAHNWDDCRDVLDAEGNLFIDADGNPLREEYDDGKGDKPSCFSGVKKRLFQALLYHPLYTPLDKEIVRKFVNKAIHDYYQGIILGYKLETLEQLTEAVGEYFVNFVEHALIDALQLPESYAQTIKEALASQFGEKRAALFFPIIDKLLSQEGLIANDFLRFYQSAELDKLLKQASRMIDEVQPLREIIDIVTVKYLFQQAHPRIPADFVAFNRLACDVQAHGVGGIWSKIETDVKAQYLALDDEEANNENWHRLAGLVKATALSQEAQGIIQGKMQEAVKASPGYQAYRTRGGEGGSGASFFFTDVEIQHPVLVSPVNRVLAECDEKSSSAASGGAGSLIGGKRPRDADTGGDDEPPAKSSKTTNSGSAGFLASRKRGQDADAGGDDEPPTKFRKTLK